LKLFEIGANLRERPFIKEGEARLKLWDFTETARSQMVGFSTETGSLQLSAMRLFSAI
jgi:hypothetical protein